uniref:Uncharacterized protein n=1 Tax=Rhizophora mucronata TaxID=61149 RepID=A0A2P2NGM9_RHIMU
MSEENIYLPMMFMGTVQSNSDPKRTMLMLTVQVLTTPSHTCNREAPPSLFLTQLDNPSLLITCNEIERFIAVEIDSSNTFFS